MKQLIICIALFFSYTSVFTQTNLDSLYLVWKDTNRPDSDRVDAIGKFIWDGYLFSEPDSALIYVNELYDYAQKHNLDSHKATALDIKGSAYFLKGDYKNALKYYNECLKIDEGLDDKEGMAAMYSNIGNVYVTIGENSKGLDFFDASLKIYEEIGNLEYKAAILGNIGKAYREVGDSKKAMEYYNACLKIEREIGSKYGMSNSFIDIGVLYNESGDYDTALSYFNKGLKLKQELKEIHGVAIVYENLGSLFVNKQDFKKAEESFINSLNIFEEIGDKNGISSSLIYLGTINNLQQYFRKAIEFCSRGLQMSSETRTKLNQKKACDCLYRAYKGLNNDNKALKNLELSLAYRDSLGEIETAKQLQNMEFNKERLRDSLIQEEEKLKTKMIHQAEVRKKDKNRNLALGAGLFFLLVSGGLCSRYRFTKKAKAVIEKEKDRSENLLLNILPAEVAEELKEKGEAEAQDFEMVSILFSDFKGFTGLSEKMTAKDLVGNINECFKAFDTTMQKYNIEKIKTIGDAYMAAGGLPVKTNDSVKNTVLAALEMQDFIIKLHKKKEAKGEHAFEMRVGIHTGPVVAGIVGVKKFQYDIWGDTVNTASRMESSGEVGKVNISQDTYNYIKDEPEFSFESRGKIQAKGKGEVEMYFVSLK